MIKSPNIVKKIAHEIIYRQHKVATASNEQAREGHERAIAKLVVQRMCDHDFNLVAKVNGRYIQQCPKCKFKYMD